MRPSRKLVDAGRDYVGFSSTWDAIVAEVVQMELLVKALAAKKETVPVPTLVEEANKLVDEWRGVA
jgi:hypothetical protein